MVQVWTAELNNSAVLKRQKKIPTFSKNSRKKTISKIFSSAVHTFTIVWYYRRTSISSSAFCGVDISPQFSPEPRHATFRTEMRNFTTERPSDLSYDLAFLLNSFILRNVALHKRIVFARMVLKKHTVAIDTLNSVHMCGLVWGGGKLIKITVWKKIGKIWGITTHTICLKDYILIYDLERKPSFLTPVMETR